MLLNHARSHLCGDLRRPIARVAVDNDDFRRQIRRKVRETLANRLRFIMGRDNDGDSHSTDPGRLATTTTEDGRRRASKASTPHVRPAAPTATPSDASTGTSSSHIHDGAPLRHPKAPEEQKRDKATGRVNRPMTSSMPVTDLRQP